MKKTLCILFVVFMAAGAILANGDADTESADSKMLIYNSMHGDPKPRAADEEVVAMFQEKHPDIQVVHSIVAHEDFKQAIRAYLSSSSPPDLLTWFAGNRARFFIDKGLILDISDVWEKEGWNDSYAASWKAMSSVNGKQYFLPNSWYWWAVYYRPSVFDKHNLTAPENWDQFIALNDTLLSLGIKPFTIGTKYRWTAAAWFDYFNMRLNGPEFHINLMLGSESYDDPRVVAVFKEWARFIDAGYFIDNPAAYAWAEAIPFMGDESAAMYLMGDFIRDSFPEDLLDAGDLDFFRFPIYDGSLPVGEDAPTDGYFISAQSKNPEEAKELLAYFGSVEVQEYFAKTMNRLSTNGGVNKDLYDASQQKGIAMIESADFVAQFYDRDTTPEMANFGMDIMMEFWVKHSDSDIQNYVKRLEKKRQEVFTE